MQKSVVIWVACVFFANLTLWAQCPDKTTLRQRIILLKESTKVPSSEKLTEMQRYLSAMNRCAYKNDSTHVSLLHFIGWLYNQQGDFAKAVEYRKQAITMVMTNAGSDKIKLTVMPAMYYWLSVSYDSVNLFKEKMAALDSCASIAIRLSQVDRASLTAVYTFIQYFFDIGDYKRCIDYTIKCQLMAKQYGNQTPAEQKVAESFASSSFGWQVIALIKLKNFSEAEKLLSNKVTEYQKAGATNYLGTTFSQLAELQLNKGDYAKALLYYKQALNYDQKAAYVFNCKQTLRDIGYAIYFNHYRDRKKALNYYKKALSLVNKDKALYTADVFESLDIFAKIAAIHVREKNYDSAFYYYRVALNQIRPGGETAIVYNSSDEIIRYKKIHYLTRLLLDKGDALVQQHNDTKRTASLAEAVAVFKITDQLLDRIRAEQKDPQSKLFWRSDSRRLYENAIEACYRSGNQKDVLYFFEKSRAVLLSDQLQEQHWAAGEDMKLQTQLQKKIVQLEREAGAINQSSPGYTVIQTEIFNQKHRLDQIKQRLRLKSPVHYQYFSDSSSLNLRDVQKNILKDHKALLELYEGDSAVYSLLITANKVQLQKINKASFDSLSHRFMSFLSSSSLLNKNYPAFTVTAKELYQLIFQGLHLPNGRIIISPGGTNFPYEALVTSQINQPLSYFIEDHAVSYTFSARYLLHSFSETDRDASMFLGVAPVSYLSSLQLAALPGSDYSVKQLQNLFGNASTLTTDKALKNNFVQQFYRYKIVQLYTHSTDSGYRGEPTIYFRDSALLLSDLIYDMKPATSLIVLSACETGKGALYQGEGVFSFSRGFAAIGIPSSVTNLWQVDNESTYRLTEVFYKWLAKGEPIDIALQKAKMEFIQSATKEKKMPYYWAAAILAGASDPIRTEKNLPRSVFAGLVVMISLFFISWQARLTKTFS